MRQSIPILILVVFIAACTPSKKLVNKEPLAENQEHSKYDESFDPLSLNDDDIIIQAKTETEVVEKKKSEKTTSDQTKILREIDGYRVQLLATRSIESATLIKQRAEEQFLKLNHKVYWSFEAPFYKVRIGDVLTRTDAESIRDLARSMGYDQAFPVRSKVMPPDQLD